MNHQPSATAGATADAGGTGDSAVDEALSTLNGLESQPVHRHAAVIENVHQALRDRLADEPVDEQLGEGQG
ncbi:hypothetical protein G1H11_23790 [Phytoactinopolyspora alkaliphila]|uniref:Uncharacterized protein n=2 Tax=Phytoactinopolyspora alkaliphila TaxID=1783498 RepID=A0A6N9YTS1_9ACTN|nr:hypothetical protein [Phytoactinopolyspora alkaliphila]